MKLLYHVAGIVYSSIMGFLRACLPRVLYTWGTPPLVRTGLSSTCCPPSHSSRSPSRSTGGGSGRGARRRRSSSSPAATPASDCRVRRVIVDENHGNYRRRSQPFRNFVEYDLRTLLCPPPSLLMPISSRSRRGEVGEEWVRKKSSRKFPKRRL